MTSEATAKRLASPPKEIVWCLKNVNINFIFHFFVHQMFISQFEVQKASDLSLIEEIVRTDFHGNEKKNPI